LQLERLKELRKEKKKKEGTREAIDYEDSERNTKGGHDVKWKLNSTLRKIR
jgi:hypothetical protein